jgi:hypothetical protein
VLKQAPSEHPRLFLQQRHQPSAVRSAVRAVQRGTNPSRFIRCIMQSLRDACMYACIVRPPTLSRSLLSWCRGVASLRFLDCYWEEGVVQPQCFANLSGTLRHSQALTPPKAQRWWGRIGEGLGERWKRYRRESPARGRQADVRDDCSVYFVAIVPAAIITQSILSFYLDNCNRLLLRNPLHWMDCVNWSQDNLD